MSELADTIKSRGFWRVTVRPSRFDPNHIDDYNRLFAVVRDSAVELRGWDCPHIDTQNPPRRENVWVGQETGWEHYRELWRLYRSGQFLFLGGYEEDWRDHSGLWPHPPKWEFGRLLWIQDAIFSLTEFSVIVYLLHVRAGAVRVGSWARKQRGAGLSSWESSQYGLPVSLDIPCSLGLRG